MILISDDATTTTPEDITTTTPEDVTTIPDGCLNYFLLYDPSRNKNYGLDHNYGLGLCDYSNPDGYPVYPYPSIDWQGSGWYKALLYGPTSEPSKITEDIVYGNHCNAQAAGWLNGTHPTLIGQTVQREVCFSYGNDPNDICALSTDIYIRNCGEYFLYNLVNVEACSSRYCFE